MRRQQNKDLGAETIVQIRNRPENAACADCKTVGPMWASVTYGCFICINCSIQHRQLEHGRVKSVNLDRWTSLNLSTMRDVGNAKVNSIYECNVPATLPENCAPGTLEYARHKYEYKTWADNSKLLREAERIMTIINKRKRIKASPSMSCSEVGSPVLDSSSVSDYFGKSLAGMSEIQIPTHTEEVEEIKHTSHEKPPQSETTAMETSSARTLPKLDTGARPIRVAASKRRSRKGGDIIPPSPYSLASLSNTPSPSTPSQRRIGINSRNQQGNEDISGLDTLRNQLGQVSPIATSLSRGVSTSFSPSDISLFDINIPTPASITGFNVSSPLTTMNADIDSQLFIPAPRTQRQSLVNSLLFPDTDLVDNGFDYVSLVSPSSRSTTESSLTGNEFQFPFELSSTFQPRQNYDSPVVFFATLSNGQTVMLDAEQASQVLFPPAGTTALVVPNTLDNIPVPLPPVKAESMIDIRQPFDRSLTSLLNSPPLSPQLQNSPHPPTFTNLASLY